MDWLHQQCMYDEDRARRGSFYDYPPLITERTFVRLIIGFGVLLVLAAGAHVVEGSHAPLHTTTRAELNGPQRPAQAHGIVGGRVASRRAGG
jgi:hypothetical protein